MRASYVRLAGLLACLLIAEGQPVLLRGDEPQKAVTAERRWNRGDIRVRETFGRSRRLRRCHTRP